MLFELISYLLFCANKLERSLRKLAFSYSLRIYFVVQCVSKNHSLVEIFWKHWHSLNDEMKCNTSFKAKEGEIYDVFVKHS